MDSSLNLNTLASSLPSSYQNAEKELMVDFKAAALSITNLYRSSRNASKRAYNAGYLAACQDVLSMIQLGVSDGGIGHASADSGNDPDNGMSIGRVMDWIEARRDAIKAREEEEDEDEENQKLKEREQQRASVARDVKATKSSPPPAVMPQLPQEPELTSSRPRSSSASLHPSHAEASSPSPPTTLRSIVPPQSAQRSQKRAKDAVVDAPTFAFVSPNAFPGSPASNLKDGFPDPIPIVAGAKRRHAMMMMLDSASPPVPITSASANLAGTLTPVSTGNSMPLGAHGLATSSRRRTRSSRMISHQQNQNVSLLPGSEAMDVEDEGRERKRVARR